MIIENEMVFKISEFVKVREEDFGLLLVSKKTPILALNKDSRLIWNNINGESSVEQIVKKVNSSIDGDDKEIQAIVKEFIDSCYKLRLIEIV